jgi:hypothetical protein
VALQWEVSWPLKLLQIEPVVVGSTAYLMQHTLHNECTVLSTIALMTRPSALRLLLISPASFARSSVAPDLHGTPPMCHTAADGTMSCLLSQTCDAD